jgi:hypothetical protein
MAGPSECSRVFGFAGLGIVEHGRETHNGVWCVSLNGWAEIYRASCVVRIIQRPLMLPADEDIRFGLIYGVQKPGIGAIPLITDDHIAGLEAIMLQAFALCRLGQLDFMQAKGDDMNDKGEAISAAGRAWALGGGPITGEEAEMLGYRG